MERAVVYGLSRSVYTRIARLALEEKGVDYALEETEIFGATGVPPEYFDRHPFGRIPTLSHGDLSVYETCAITRYVDEAFPGPPLQPAAPSARARMTQVISVMDAYAYRPMIWGVFVQRIAIPRRGGATNEAKIAESLPMIETCLKALELLLDRHAFFAGDQLTLADLHAAPILLYFSLTPEGERLLGLNAGLRRWLTDISARPSVQRTRSVYE